MRGRAASQDSHWPMKDEHRRNEFLGGIFCGARNALAISADGDIRWAVLPIPPIADKAQNNSNPEMTNRPTSRRVVSALSDATKRNSAVKMQTGDVNHNNQKLLAKTMQPGNGLNARIWI